MPAPATVTLGEQCYLAYWRRWKATALPYRRLTQRERAAWEAAARAAVEVWQVGACRQERSNGTSSR